MINIKFLIVANDPENEREKTQNLISKQVLEAWGLIY